MSSIVCSNLSFAWPTTRPFRRTVVHRRLRPHRPGRTQRRRQEHPAQAHRRRVPAHRRIGDGRRHRRLSAAVTAVRRGPHRGRRAGRCRRDRRPEALDAGDTGDDVFATIGDDWDVEERTRAQLDRLGLGHIAVDRRLGRCPAAKSSAGLGWRRSYSSGPMCCCSTSRPTTSTSTHGTSSTTRSTTSPVPAAGQPRPRAARPDGPHRRAAPRRNPVLRGNFTMYQQAVDDDNGSRRTTSATPNSSSSARSGSVSRPANVPHAGPAPRLATSRTPACQGLSRESSSVTPRNQRVAPTRCMPRVSPTQRRSSTTPNVRCATTTPSCSTCPIPTCPPGARSSPPRDCRSAVLPEALHGCRPRRARARNASG